MYIISILILGRFDFFSIRPNDDEAISDDYKNARLAGEQGLDCAALYHCRFEDGFFDKFSYLA